MEGYDVGMVCMNGHAVNSMAATAPQHNEKFCSKCGAAAIQECPQCHERIRGYYHYENVFGGSWYVPAHCHACGKPYPWTQGKAEALGEMIEELDGLSDEEREKLKVSIPDIIADTPKSETAALRFKKAVAKVGQAGGKMLMDVITNVATEAVKKAMGL